MGDWPHPLTRDPTRGLLLSPFDSDTPLGDLFGLWGVGTIQTGTTWTANLAVYAPIVVKERSTVTGFLTSIVTQAGNVDAGIYDWAGNRVVSNGGVACGAAGVQVIDCTDTALDPGWYRIAFACNSASTVVRTNGAASGPIQACGVFQQSSAYPLPSTATPAAYSGKLPQVVAALSTTL